MEILLAVDGSDYTKRMLSYLTSHENWFDPNHAYTVFHTVLAVTDRAAEFVGPELVHGYYEDEAQIVMEPIRAFLTEHGIEATFVHTFGHPAEEIAAYADEQEFDLLVMGSHGHSALANLVLGSVATKVLGGCTVPVLLVR